MQTQVPLRLRATAPTLSWVVIRNGRVEPLPACAPDSVEFLSAVGGRSSSELLSPGVRGTTTRAPRELRARGFACVR